MNDVFLGLGSNLGDRLQNLRFAREALRELGEVTATSPIYLTAPVYYVDQDSFLNCVIRLSTPLPPQNLLARLRMIEASLRRERTIPNGPRTIDLDILFFGNQILSTPELTVPHSRLAERAFVLIPLAEIAPTFVHPVLQRTVQDLLSSLPERTAVEFHSTLD